MFTSYHEIYEMDLNRRQDMIDMSNKDSQIQKIQRRKYRHQSSSNLIAKLSFGLIQLGLPAKKE